MKKQLIINSLIIVTFLIITVKGNQENTSITFTPPEPTVNQSLCISLNLGNSTNKTFYEINFKFKPPTYNEISIFTFNNGIFRLNDEIIEKYFTTRLNKNTTNATNFCLINVLKEDLAYFYQWTYDEYEISFRLRNSSQDQPPNINATFFEPAIPKFHEPICYSLNYSLDSNTLLDNIVLSAKYRIDTEWEEIYRLSENKLQYNNNSKYYSNLDLNKTKFNYFCFKTFNVSDRLIDFKWEVFDLNFNNKTKTFNNDYNGKLNGNTKINYVKSQWLPNPEKLQLCINLDYNLNYNGSTNSLPQFNLKINGDIFIYLNNSFFAYNLAFENKTFAERVDKYRTTLTHLCLKNVLDTDTSIEFSWYIKDWTNTEVKKIFYLPGFSTSGHSYIMEKYDKMFDLGYGHFCVSVMFSLLKDDQVYGISLYSRRRSKFWQNVFEYNLQQDELIYNQNDNIDVDSKRSNGFCFTEVNANVIHSQYRWKITTLQFNILSKEFSLKSDHWQIESPQMYQIETNPSVPQPNQAICFFLKYKIDSHTSLDSMSFGTYDLTEINYEEIIGSYQEIFHIFEDNIVYNQNHPLYFNLNIISARSDYDQICFNSLYGNYKHFKWHMKDLYNQIAEMSYSLPQATSPDLRHNITSIIYDPIVAEVHKPLSISLNFTGEHNSTNLHLYASDPGKLAFKLIYTYSYLNNTYYFCDGTVSEICERVDQTQSNKNTISLKTLTLADSFRNFYWSIEDTLGYFNYPYSFDVFAYPVDNPVVTLQSQQFQYTLGDHIVAECSFENVTVNPKLYWGINDELTNMGDMYYSHSNYTINNPNWYTSVKSFLNIEITHDLVVDGKNLILTCHGEMGYKGSTETKQLQIYETRNLLRIEGAKNGNETIINSVSFFPPGNKRHQPVCVSVNYSSSAEVFSLSLIQTDGDTIKVIYDYNDGKITFPDSVNLTSRIDLKNTNNTSFCLEREEKIDEREYYWIINDNERNQVMKQFELVTYGGPTEFNLRNLNDKDYYLVGDYIEGDCLIRDIRPKPTVDLYLDEQPFQSSWYLSVTSPNKDSYDSISIFTFKVTSEITKKNMSLISCKYSLGDIVKNETQVAVYFNSREKVKKSSNAGVIAGAIIGVIIALAIIAGVGYYFYKKRSQDPERTLLVQHS